MNDHQEWKQLLSAYFDDELSSEEKDTVNNHLVDCPACQKYLKELQSLSLKVKALKNEPLSPDLEQRLNNLNQTRTEGPNMQKSTVYSFLKSVAPVVALVFVVVVMMQTYAQRAIQARIKDASQYMTGQTIALGTSTQYEPYYQGTAGRLKSAADDIGDQYSAGNTPVTKTRVAQPAEKIAGTKYEAYYSQSNYDIARESVDTTVHNSSSVKDAKGMAMAAGASGGTAYANRKQAASPVPSSQFAFAVSGKEGSLTKDKEAAKKLTWNETATTASYRDELSKDGAYDYNGEDLEGRVDRRAYANKQPVVYENGYVVPQYPYTQIQVPGTNTAQYDPIAENEFKEVTQDPLSTFSIDVDTASYSNVRRFLNGNQLPPTDAVRIEEMINYFQYNYPQPSWNQPVSITMEHGLCPWNTNHQLVLVGLQGKELSARQTPTSNLVFLIDVSGSMSSQERLPLIKDAFKMMVAQLRPEEKVSIVVYAGNAGVVLDSAPGYDKGLIMNALDRLQAGGSTAGGQGIQLAYDIARKNFIQNGNNRVILATDGDFNVGISNDSELVQLIEKERKSGIFLTTLGVGTDNLKDSKMQKLADAGNGNYFYLDTIQEAQKVLVEELGSTLIAIAKDVKIQVEFNPNQVKAYRLIGYEKRKLNKEDFNNDAKDAGELGAGHSVTALYEIVPAGSWEAPTGNVDPLKYQQQAAKKPFFGNNDHEIMTVKVRYKEPKSETSQLITKVLKTPVKTFGQSWFGYSDNLQFASAVAEFGMLLRDSNFKSYATYQSVIQRAQNSAYYDAHGYKNEFIGLVQKAESLDNRPQPVQIYQPRVPMYQIPIDNPQGYNQK